MAVYHRKQNSTPEIIMEAHVPPKSKICTQNSLCKSKVECNSNYNLQLIPYVDPNIQHEKIIKHQNVLFRPNFGDCSTPIPVPKKTVEQTKLLGLSEDDWEKFSGFLGNMGVSLIPIKQRTSTKKRGEISSSKKGVKELKNLKCDITYEKGRGVSHNRRGVNRS
ncbi:hypothetical protein LguiB_028143 [Lonicera macranthoides]